MRGRLWFVLIAGLLAMPLRAQPPGWSAVLYESLTGEVVRVDAAGTVTDSFVLPRPEGTSPPQGIAVGPGGDVLAYVAYGDTPTLIFYERGTGASTSLPLPPNTTTDSLAFVASDDLFSPDDAAFAFAYANADGAWLVTLYSRTEDGWVPSATLNERASLPELATLNALGRTPIVKSLSADGGVTLALAEPFSGYAANFDAHFRWDTLTNTLTRLPYPTTADGDYLAGREVTPLYDPAYPNNAAAFPYPQANALYLTEPDGTRRLLFNSANLSLFWGRFVADGAAVLAGGYSPQNRLTWFLLDSTTGDLLSIDLPPVQMTGAQGTPEGFAYTVGAGAGAGTLLYAVTVAGGAVGEPSEVWAGPPGGAYRIVWAGASTQQ